MQAQATEHDLSVRDLGPLAWVLDELRKSLDSSFSALRRFLREAAQADSAEAGPVDPAQLRIARQNLHQALGALEMVGLRAPAQLLRAMEAALQAFVQRPELCVEAASAKVERAGFALLEFLEALLAGQRLSAVALFPQYREVQALSGAERVHPADLWSLDWRWQQPQTPQAPQALTCAPAVRARMDQAVLRLVKSADATAAHELARVSLGLAAGAATQQQITVFWKVCAGFFEAMALGLLPHDLYVKRAASRVLVQYSQLAKGEQSVSDRLVQDLVFFCGQAVPPTPAEAPSLHAVRQAWGLLSFAPVAYEREQFGRFEPALLAQVRKRIAAAKEIWSQLAGGDGARLRSCGDHFRQLADALTRLHPASAALATALQSVGEEVTRANQLPRPEMAMEVATAVLYLEAAFQDLDADEEQLRLRAVRMAQRLDQARAGAPIEALEPWMEDLYRRVSDRQTMGSVVGELRLALAEVEKDLDSFFRDSQDPRPLQSAPARLAQMRGVLSVLDLPQADQAVLRMRDAIEALIASNAGSADIGEAAIETLGNNLGALGLLIDMLNYQPALAKKLFEFDPAAGELRPLMGRSTPTHAAVDVAADDLAQAFVPTEAPPADPAAVDGDAATTGTPEAASTGLNLPDLDGLAVTELAELAEVDGTGGAPAVPETTALSWQQLSPADALAFFQDPAEPSRPDAPGHDASDSLLASGSIAAFDPPASDHHREPAFATPSAAGAALAWPTEASQSVPDDDPQEELRSIFIEEAREVVETARAALHTLSGQPSDLGELTVLRRAFHTLKGSSRMVGLAEFGEAAWSLEQVFNAWLAEQKSASAPLLVLAGRAIDGFGRWAQDIADAREAGWHAKLFSGPADAFRIEDQALPFVFPGEEPAPAEAAEPSVEAPGEILETARESSQDALPQVSVELETVNADEPAVQSINRADAVTPLQTLGTIEADGALDVQTVEEIEAIEVEAVETDEAVEAGPIEAVEAPAEPTELVPDEAPSLPQPPAMAHEEGSALQGGREPVDVFDADVPSPSLRPDVHDEQIRFIGSLRIGIPLYNVFLNEADEWSRRLQMVLSEWALEHASELPEDAVAMAHSLAGSSATVGFHSLSHVARTLEHSLVRTRLQGWGTPRHAAVYNDAAEEIRRLLHQFAAGFLKDANPLLAQSLLALDNLEPVASTSVIRALPMAPAPAATAAQAERPISLDDQREGIDVADAVDCDLFPIFDEEASELLPQLGGALRQWHARPDNRSAREAVLRCLHTLKGSARLAGALRLGEMAHRLESLVEQVGFGEGTEADVEPLLQRFDAMQSAFELLRADDARAAAAVTATSVASQPQPQPQPQPEDSLAAPTRSNLAPPVSTSVTAQRATISQAVRVRSHLLDRMMNQAGEVMISRSRLEGELRQLRGSLNDLTGNLDRLRAQLRDIELQAETQMHSRLAQSKESTAGFDPLEFDRFTRVQELTRMMAESVNDIATVQRNLQRSVDATEDDLAAQARQTRELQRDLLRTRMVEFEAISDRLYRVVRQAGKDTRRQVKLDIEGGSIEMDRGVLDRMTPAFEHLLRNCVAHGIEDPAVRSAAGKDPSGHIRVVLGHEGNDVSVEFRDDGAGLDLARIRERALDKGLVEPGQVLTDAETAHLIFTAGFTTAARVTELAGRGIGMDVVRAEVNALGGRIEVDSWPGKGASFRLVLPLTTAVTQVVMIRGGSLSVGVPANLVETVRRATPREIEQAYNSGRYAHDGEQLPFFWLGALLQSSRRSAEPPARSLPVVVFRSASQRVAVHVDEVLGNQEVVVKNLGPQLARLPGLAGMSVLPSGAVVLMYNPVALATVYGEQARLFSADQAQPGILEASGAAANPLDPITGPRLPLVLVVDDSITVRRVTQRLLQREGYRVAQATDGLQAMERLAEETPALVLSDIEMPRMDGFDLARNIRGHERWSQLPIVMITSRIAEKHREHARQLGVNHYLGKPYSEDELLVLVRRYCTVPAEIPPDV